MAPAELRGGSGGETPEDLAKGQAGIEHQLVLPRGIVAGEIADVGPEQNAASTLRVVAVTDKQNGVVGTLLSRALAVAVRDANGRPVQGASVDFIVQQGGGMYSVVYDR